MTRLWAAAPALPHADQLVMPPWEDEDINGFLAGENESGDAATPVIHPNVMASLLAWSLIFVTELADDVIAALDFVETARRNFPESPIDSRRVARTVPAKHGGVLPGFMHRAQISPSNIYLAVIHGGVHPDDLSGVLKLDRASFTVDR